ncbi:MAG: hypothetical protein QXW98_04550 [Candidatus Caldarchaeum sp.]
MRVTVDIDGLHREWWAWSVYYMMRDSGQFQRVEIYRTRKGYHIIGYGTGLSETEINHLRRMFGDDQLRLEIDILKNTGQPKQVLWTVKNGYEVKLLERT